MLEIGAGSGRLTSELARRARRVVAVEIDATLATRLRGRWPNVLVAEADALTLPLPREPFRVVANLPFHRTTDALRHLLDDPLVPLLRADLVVEWGVALKRAAVWPSSMRGVLWGAWYRFGISRHLPAAWFDPAPDVDAGVLRVVRREEPLVAPEAAGRYARFVGRGFRHGLAAVAPRRALAQVGASTRTPPRELDAHRWAALFAASDAAATVRRTT